MERHEKLLKLDIVREKPVLVKPCENISPHVLNLTNLDRLYNYNNTLGFFYPPSPTKNSYNVAGVLKESLQKLLQHFPWAAGRLRSSPKDQRLEVYCNAQGAQFVSAATELRFDDLGDVSVVNPALDVLLPGIQSLDDGSESLPLVAIQVTRFSCGGFVLGVMTNHALLDGHSASHFINNLCSLARSSELCVPSEGLDRRQILRPRNPPAPTFDYTWITTKSGASFSAVKINTSRSFSLSEKRVEMLRRQALSQTGVVQCSRFVAIAAHLWMAKAISLAAVSPVTELPLRIPVDLRERFGLAIPNGYLGNAICYAEAKATVKDLRDKPLAFVVEQIQKAMSILTAEYVQSYIDYIESFGSEARQVQGKLVIPYLGRFPFYDCDCGWGAPKFFGRPSKQFSNRIHVLPADTEGRSFTVLAAFDSEEESSRFEDAFDAVMA